MAKDKITLKLDGKVPLDAFSKTISTFSDLLKELSKEIAGDTKIDWEIVELEAGSTYTGVVGHSPDVEEVERVVVAYESIGFALETRGAIPYSDSVALKAYALVSDVGGPITSVQLGSGDRVFTVAEPYPEQQHPKHSSLGTVTGTAETLSSRRRLNMVVYDHIFDSAIFCYFREDQEKMLPNLWRKRVRVTGRVTRDPDTGKPIEVRDITNVEIETPSIPGAYKKARGIYSFPEGDTPEEFIRRLRNGE